MKIAQMRPLPTKRLAVGIDLGTTHSLVACEIEGVLHVLPDERGEVLLPSVVHYKPNQIEVGEAAKAAVERDPENTHFSIKRLMGRQSTIKENLTPSQLSAEILKKLMQRAYKIDSQICEAVITVPAYFDEVQRQATKEAARLAGIQVLRLLNEPTAAAVAYGLDQRAQGYCLVFDLGGGTFDVSLLQLTQGVFQVLATGGDTLLGGDDIDRLIVEWMLQESQIERSDINFLQVLLKAQLAKEALSCQEKIELSLKEWKAELTITQLNKLITPFVERTIDICKRVLKDANIPKEEIEHIVLVGGSTRIPLVREKVAGYFGKAPLMGIDPDQVVAKGAAIQASLLTGSRCTKEVLLLDVIPLSLGVEMMGGIVEKMLTRNTPLPAQAKQLFTTFQEGQTGLSLHVVQGERELAKDCRSLARFDLKGIPVLPPGKARIEVTFQVDPDGLLHVEAKELSTGIYSDIIIKPTFGLNNESINNAIKEAIEYAQKDITQRKLHEKIIEAERCIHALEKTLAQKDCLLTLEESQQIESGIARLKEALEAKQGKKIKEALKALEGPSQFFAEKRLNAILEKALTGKRLDEIDENNFFTS